MTPRKTSQHIVHGINAVTSVLRRAPDRVISVYIQENLGRERAARLTRQLEACAVEVERCDSARLEQLIGTDKHQGVAALIRQAPPMDESEARDYVKGLAQPLLLVLDGIQDPRNFGACLRTADAAGVDLVVTARNRNVGFTPAVSKVASGAAEVQPVAQVGNLARFLDLVKDQGLWVVGADEHATDTVFELDLDRPLAVVLGSEGKGLRRLTRDRCDMLMRVPMHGVVESLNVSVATGICLYECLRQRAK
jgi:23S rRNA (guanosine2251-2'-O)-methyltransferase